MPFSKELIAFYQQEQTERHWGQQFDRNGIAFLRQHPLKIIPSVVFRPPHERPWIEATTNMVQLHDNENNIMCNGGVTIPNLLNALAEYDRKSKNPLIQFMYRLPEGTPMEVKWEHMDWYPLFMGLNTMFPHAVIWPYLRSK